MESSSPLSSPQLLGILNTPPRSAKRPRLVLSPRLTLQSLPLLNTEPSTSAYIPPATTAAKPLGKQSVVPSSLAGLSTSAIIPVNPSGGDQRPTPILQNVVGTADLACELDLLRINSCTRNSEFNPQRFSGIVMRIREPHTTALIFHSGKMVVTGAKSESDCNLAARKFARIIQKLGFPIKFLAFRVTNMVATCDLKFPIRVETLNQMHGQFSSYEPELFPGLIYRMIHPRVVCLVFVNGKLCFTGAKNMEELNLALENMYPILKSFKKQ